ncbi:MAG TPA: YegS/Rv2252/BmrU family lipid kinase [Flavisolibacter sp.]|jgi:YegS/Rv2252/BmrU family lipid kinase|nr:YegS/Rv2252/BmrU family lipid kinase [Flavisolibacter sp.]
MMQSGPDKHIALVCNPTADNDKAFRMTDSLSLLLTGMNLKHSIYTTYWPKEWEGITEAWIIGGDGTINWFINQYPDFNRPLALFKGGSGNDFHWMLYGEMALEKQVERVLKAVPSAVDAGICNGRMFLNGVGIGFDGAIVHDLVGKKKLAGKASYLLSILKHIVGYQEKHCTIRLPDEVLESDSFMISIANARRYGGGFHVAPRAQLTDGLLDANIVGRISPLKRIQYLPVIEKGQHLELPFITYRQCTAVRITSKMALHAHLDGEYLFDKEFDITVLPKRFTFLY